MAHIIRMLDGNVVKKLLQFKVTGIRKRGRPRLRWADSVESIRLRDYKGENLESKSKHTRGHNGGIVKGKL
ncbi:hypothetical protein TNCV_4862701 [Trichonephila clavipes]|nr:hypothetical protein TNCV_4862701 [Trichonephila clavipes]